MQINKGLIGFLFVTLLFVLISVWLMKQTVFYYSARSYVIAVVFTMVSVWSIAMIFVTGSQAYDIYKNSL